MSGEIKVIPTAWNGVTYRSRTEARWAVFFDAAGIPFEYEPESFRLSDGRLYLPDFRLFGGDIWMEVKGVKATDDEWAKCINLALIVQRPVLIAAGAPSGQFLECCNCWFDEWGAPESDKWARIEKCRCCDGYVLAGYSAPSEYEVSFGIAVGSHVPDLNSRGDDRHADKMCGIGVPPEPLQRALGERFGVFPV